MATKRTRYKKPSAKRSAQQPKPTGLPPIIASLSGILKNVDPEAYRKYLVRKHL